MTEESFHSLTEVVARAQVKLPRGVWDYIVGGAESETTLKRNRRAIDQLGFRPRVLRDVSKVDLSSEFLGERCRLPVFIAPVGQLGHFTPGAAADVAQAAAAFGVPQFLSSASPPTLEDVAAAGADAIRVYQLYVTGDADFVDSHIDRAVAADYRAFCLTVDTAWYSRRERDIHNRWGIRWKNAGFGDGASVLASLNWADIERVRARCPLPLIVKGIATAEDARLAIEYGVDVVYVSNHGGRQLDHGRGSLEVLPEILDEVGSQATVVVDGSFCRGTDILKAIALGASAVGLGRIACMGLAADGTNGLIRVLELLEDEMTRAAGMLGVTTLDELDPSYLADAPVVTEPSMLSAFPLLGLD